MAQNKYIPPLPIDAGKGIRDPYGRPSVLQPGATLPPAPPPMTLPPQMGLGDLARSLPIRGQPLPMSQGTLAPNVQSQALAGLLAALQGRSE